MQVIERGVSSGHFPFLSEQACLQDACSMLSGSDSAMNKKEKNEDE